MKKIVIIPAYNEMGNLKNVIEDINKNAKEFDYIIINDCSTDDTKIICKLNNYNVINLPVNLGIGGAVQTGFLYALENNYDIAVQFDGDGQHDAKYLVDMYKCMVTNNFDMIIGSRFIENDGFQSSFIRRIGIKYFTWLIKRLTKIKITDPTSGYRMINKNVIALFCKYYPKDYPEPESVMSVIRSKNKVGEIPVRMKERISGKSSISSIKSIYYMIKVPLAIAIDLIKSN